MTPEELDTYFKQAEARFYASVRGSMERAAWDVKQDKVGKVAITPPPLSANHEAILRRMVDDYNQQATIVRRTFRQRCGDRWFECKRRVRAAWAMLRHGIDYRDDND